MKDFDAELMDDRSRWCERHLLPHDVVSDEYRNAVLSLIGKANKAEFRGIPAGGVILKRVHGDQSPFCDEGGWSMWFHFSTPILVDVSTAGTPDVVYLASRHELADFSQLGIGT